jgi:hypothetical protein
MTRIKALSLPVVYRGGHHVVVCDGQYHWCVPDDGDPWNQGPCAMYPCSRREAEHDDS